MYAKGAKKDMPNSADFDEVPEKLVLIYLKNVNVVPAISEPHVHINTGEIISKIYNFRCIMPGKLKNALTSIIFYTKSKVTIR